MSEYQIVLDNVFQENEGRYSTEMANLEEDYTAQIKDLKNQINEKIDIINNLMDDKNNIPHVSARSVTNNNNNTMNSKKNYGSIAHLKQMNQRNEKMLGIVSVYILANPITHFSIIWYDSYQIVIETKKPN